MRKNFPTLTCEQCQQPFLARNWKPSVPAPRFCSRQCHGRSKQANVVTVECVVCHRQFPRKIWHARKTGDRGPFCGFQCYAAWQSQHLKGPNNNSWKGESSNERECAEWSRNRDACVERDGRQCRVCGSPDRLTVHHKIPWAPNQVAPHAMDNLVTLCVPCHGRLHSLMHRVPALRKLEQELFRVMESIR
jgi:5-methylcytosine-specific restriction endonuclease McrA